MRRLALAWLIAALCAAHSGVTAAQTTTARAESMEVTSRGDELLEAGKYDRAAQRYRRALEIDETNERAYVGLSSALDSLGRHTEALDQLRAAESLIGWTPAIGIQRGIHLSRLERWDDAVASLSRALDARPTSFDAAFYLASAQLAAQRWEAAVDAYDRYLETRPESLAGRDTAVQTRRAYALIGAGNHDAARRALEGVLAEHPRRLSAQMLLFTALAQGGDCAEALALYEEISALADAAPTMRYNAAVCQFRAGDDRTALATLAEYDDSEANAPKRALLLRARIHVSLGNAREAEASYRDAIAAGISAEIELARWLSGRGDDAAVVELLWPLVATTDDADVLALAGAALLDEGDADRALTATTRGVERHPSASAWTLHGRVLLKRSQWTDAARAFTSAMDIDPEQRAAAVGLGRALEHQATAAFRADDRDGARKLLTRAVAIDASAHGAAFNLALLELDRGQPQRALDLLGPRVDALPAPDSGRLLLGRAHLQLGNTDAALRELESVVASDTATPETKRLALSHLAHALAATDPQRAVKRIAQARALGDGDAARAALDAAEARARLALAEQMYRRNALGELRRTARDIDRDKLTDAGRARADVLDLYALGKAKGLPAALRALKALSNEELALLATDEIPAAAVRHAVAVDLGARFMRRSADYRRYLRSHIRAMHRAARRSRKATSFVTRWYEHMLGWAIAKPAAALARSLAADAPQAVQTPAFEHNAIIAEATTRSGTIRLSKAHVAKLEELAAAIPQALVNLAVHAAQRADHAAVIRYLEKIPAAKRTRGVSEWLRWEELMHAAP